MLHCAPKPDRPFNVKPSREVPFLTQGKAESGGKAGPCHAGEESLCGVCWCGELMR